MIPPKCTKLENNKITFSINMACGDQIVVAIVGKTCKLISMEVVFCGLESKENVYLD